MGNFNFQLSRKTREEIAKTKKEKRKKKNRWRGYWVGLMSLSAGDSSSPSSSPHLHCEDTHIRWCLIENMRVAFLSFYLNYNFPSKMLFSSSLQPWNCCRALFGRRFYSNHHHQPFPAPPPPWWTGCLLFGPWIPIFQIFNLYEKPYIAEVLLLLPLLVLQHLQPTLFPVGQT